MKLKGTHIFAVFLLVGISVHGQDLKDPTVAGFNLNVSINTSSNTVKLLSHNDGKFKLVDSASVVDGKVRFSDQLQVPRMYYLDFESNFKLPIFLESSEIDVEVNGFSIDSCFIAGSGIHNEWAEIKSDIESYDSELDSIRSRYYSAKSKQNQLLMDKFVLQYDSIEVLKDAAIDSIILSRTNSYISPYLVVKYKMYGGDPEALERYRERFSSSVLKSPYIVDIDKRITTLNLSKVGNQIPEFKMADSTGIMRSIEEYKGSYVLIDFWASWCGPCRRENPNIVAAYKEYKDYGFTVLGVSLDKEREAWLKAVKKDELTWTQVSDLKGWENSVARMFGVRSIPFSILIDPNGVIIAKDLNGEALISELEKLLLNEQLREE
ncbi:MAG: redoxin domain-containing protein [Fluviicola sp.]